MWISWAELGKPTKPGTVSTRHGEVYVTEKDIETAAEANGNCEFEMIDVTAAKDEIKRWQLRHARRTDQ